MSSWLGDILHTETDSDGITYKLRVMQDNLPIRGNAISTGDPAQDKSVEDELIKRSDRGDVWAWAQVTVIASADGFEGMDHLVGCSYRDTKDFIGDGKEGDYADMKAEAKRELLDGLKRAVVTLAALESTVKNKKREK
jgi:hypothetical protein